MPYRDDEAALEQRIAHLDEELAEARAKLRSARGGFFSRRLVRWGLVALGTALVGGALLAWFRARDAGPPAPTAPAAGLVAHYRGNGVDLSGHGNHGNLHGNVKPTADRFGKPGLAASYDGSLGTYIDVAPGKLLPVGAAPRTVSAWIQTTHVYPTQAGAIVNWGSGVSQGRRFGLLANGSGDYFVGQSVDVWGTKMLGDGRWHNVVATFDGTTVHMYVDVEASASLQASLDTAETSVVIGHATLDHGTPEPFNGAIDDVRIYDRVLGDDERRQLYLEGGWHGRMPE